MTVAGADDVGPAYQQALAVVHARYEPAPAG
jgi:hypothetical protein